jgi:hypothetical protein
MITIVKIDEDRQELIITSFFEIEELTESKKNWLHESISEILCKEGIKIVSITN